MFRCARKPATRLAAFALVVIGCAVAWRAGRMSASSRLLSVIAGLLAVGISGCGGGVGTSPSGTSAQTFVAASSTPGAEATTGQGSARPASDISVVVIDTGLESTGVGDVVFYSSAVGAGRLWLGSPKGLIQIDPATNTAHFVDHERGASLSVLGNILWRSALAEDTVRRYQLDSAKRLDDLEIPGPLDILATDDGVWVSEHVDGFVVKLDPGTGEVVATTTVTTPECCGASGLAMVGGRLFVSVTKDGTIVELDPASAKVVGTHQLPSACDLLRYAAGALWTCWVIPDEVANDRSVYVQRLDPATFASQRIEVGLHSGLPGEVNGEAWIPVGNTLVQLDRVTGAPVRAVRLDEDGFDGSHVTEALGSVWVYSRYDGRVIRLRPEDLR